MFGRSKEVRQLRKEVRDLQEMVNALHERLQERSNLEVYEDNPYPTILGLGVKHTKIPLADAIRELASAMGFRFKYTKGTKEEVSVVKDEFLQIRRYAPEKKTKKAK